MIFKVFQKIKEDLYLFYKARVTHRPDPEKANALKWENYTLISLTIFNGKKSLNKIQHYFLRIIHYDQVWVILEKQWYFSTRISTPVTDYRNRSMETDHIISLTDA